jgi:hypothetical protein
MITQGSASRSTELGLVLTERRRVHDIGPLHAIDVTVVVSAGVAGFSLWTDRDRHFGSVSLPAGALLLTEVFEEASLKLGPYPSSLEAAEATLRRLLACVALMAASTQTWERG